MIDFFYKNKIYFQYETKFSLICSSCIAIFPAILINDIPTISYRILLFIAIVTGYTVTAILVVSFVGYIHLLKKRSSYAIPVISDFIHQHDFKSITSPSSKWHLAREAMEAKINGFPVRIEKCEGKSKTAVLSFMVNLSPSTRKQINELIGILKKHNSEFGIDCIKLYFRYHKSTSSNVLIDTVDKFSVLLYQLSFVPAKKI